MAKRDHRTTLDRFLLAITALFMMGGFLALGLLKNVSQENRALIVMVSSLGMIGGLAMLMLVNVVWIKLRRWTWQRAMVIWHRSLLTENSPKFAPEEGLTEDELKQLAIQTYSRIGYRRAHHEDSNMYLRLVNPDGKIELVACKQQSEQVALHQVYPLELEMKRLKAVRGFFWAPVGFTDESTEWVVHRPIILADRVEIGRLVDCAQARGSSLLEQY